MDLLTKAKVTPTQTVYSDSDATPKKPKRPLRRPYRVMTIYGVWVYIPNLSLRNRRMLNVSEYQQLRNEVHLLCTEQRRMAHNKTSQTNASVRTYIRNDMGHQNFFTAFRYVNQILVTDLYMSHLHL